MNVGWPEGIMLALLLIGTGLQLAVHGQPRTGKVDALVTVASTCVILALLWWGGFFA